MNMNRAKSRYRNQRPTTSAGAGDDGQQQQPFSLSASPPTARQRAGTVAASSAAPAKLSLAPQRSYDPLNDPYAQPILSPTRSHTVPVEFQPDAQQLLAGERERAERIKIRQQAELRAQKEAERLEWMRKEQEQKAEQEKRRAELERQRGDSAPQRIGEAEVQEWSDEDADNIGGQHVRQSSRQIGQKESLHNLSGHKLAKKDSIGGGLDPSLGDDVPGLEATIAAKPGIFGMFKRRKAQDSTKSMSDLRERAEEKAKEKPKFIKQGGGGIVPGTDAPVSAVNAGDRRVKVELNSSFAILPVNPETTPQDLIRSASIVMSQPIDYSTAFLVEHFVKVGLQRPLRKYERVRDVLNSWDEDDANSLLIMHSQSAGSEAELTQAKVPTKSPSCLTGWPLNYSQKPGKWEKRHVTLDSDGQVWMAKNDEGKDKEKLCHLSDFDIYSPTPKKLKKVKPPKKICYAIKSQQKSTMFLNTTSFVHFFCLSDTGIADAFYGIIQMWRSWYLVNVMGEGASKKQGISGADVFGSRQVSGPQAGRKSTDRNVSSHNRHTSTDSYYQLGTFKSLLDIEELTSIDPPYEFPSPPKVNHPRRPSEANSISISKPANPLPDDAPLHILANPNARNASVRYRSAGPPSTFRTQQKKPNDPSLTTGHGNDQETFSSSGLLGRQHSQRRREVEQSGGRVSSDGHNNSGGLQRNTSVRSYHRSSSGEQQASDPSSGLNRRGSVRTTGPPAKPLVDLTPQYKEPPQFQKKGKGYSGPMGPGGLVESATSGPQDVIAVPPSQNWRGRNASVGAADQHQQQRYQHQQQSHSARPQTSSRTQRHASPAVGGTAAGAALLDNGFDGRAFTGGGLLAGAAAKGGWGDRGLGQGVPMKSVKGRRGGTGTGAGPLLDVRSESEFADGSLLRRVERSRG